MKVKEACTKLFNKVRANPELDYDRIEKAYILAKEAHQDQFRKSGEGYIIHPIEVSEILVDLKMDTDTIVAGLLHDVVEDTLITISDIQYEFGEDVANLVAGVTKLRNLPRSQGKEIENVRKMVVAMARDIRVVIIKLADRLHNMRTIQFQSPEKQIEKSLECLDVFAPIAHRIGMAKIKSELEDISFRYIHPKEYEKIKTLVNQKKVEREKITKEIINEVEKYLNEEHIKATVNGRAKHFYSIYKKIIIKNKDFSELMDLIAIRILVDTQEDCYRVLGIIHSKFPLVQGRFKDYIGVPKPNGYQSIHTTIEYGDGHKVEIQIRTHTMHDFAENGVAAHWKYKEKKNKDKNEKYYQTIKNIINKNDTQEFTDSILNETIFVFTPKGDVKEIQNGATALDFAFLIHTQIGYRTIGVKVNDKIVPLDYKLKNGDKVEVLTSKNAKGPGKDWENMVSTSSSQAKIRKWFKDLEFEEKVKDGKQLVEDAFSKVNIKFDDIIDDERLYLFMKKYNLNTVEQLFYRIMTQNINIETLVNKFKVEEQQTVEEMINEAEEKGSKIVEKSKENSSKLGIKISGSDNTEFSFAKCCDPLPGDDIQGYVSTIKGKIVIHKTNCKNFKTIVEKQPGREVDVYWDEKLLNSSNAKYQYTFTIKANDRDGLLYDVIKILNENRIDIVSANTMVKSKDGKDLAIITLRIMIRNKEEFERIKNNILSISEVLEVQ